MEKVANRYKRINFPSMLHHLDPGRGRLEEMKKKKNKRLKYRKGGQRKESKKKTRTNSEATRKTYAAKTCPCPCNCLGGLWGKKGTQDNFYQRIHKTILGRRGLFGKKRNKSKQRKYDGEQMTREKGGELN